MASIVESISDNSYTLSISDDQKILRFTSNSAITVTCPSDLTEGMEVVCIQDGNGQITFVAQNPATFLNAVSPITQGPRSYVAVTLEANATYAFNGKIGNAPDAAVNANFILLENIQTSGTNGGAIASGSYLQLTLNTESFDTGNNCSLSGNRFTLDDGTYIINARSTASSCDEFKTKLVRDPAGSPTDEKIGTCGYADNAGTEQTHSDINCHFFVSGGGETFEIQGQVAASGNQGHACSFGDNEVYHQVELLKIL